MKKLAVVFLALALVLTTVLVPILADGEEITTIGFSSARVKRVNLTGVDNLNDYDEGNVKYAYIINDAAGMVKLAELVNSGKQSFKGINIYLSKDIDMASVEDMQPIGQYTFTATQHFAEDHPVQPNGVSKLTFGEQLPFCGTFNGQGHVIKNWKVTFSGDDYVYGGFFGYVTAAVITNLIIDESCLITTTSYNDYGGVGIVGKATGKTLLENVYNLADIDAQHPHAAFVGRGCATFKNCTNLGDFSAVKTASGFTAYVEGGAIVIENCRNAGNITAQFAGGVTGRVSQLTTAINCINNGTVTTLSYTGNQVGFGGGILSRIETKNKHSFKDCTNYGEVKGERRQEDAPDFIIHQLYNFSTENIATDNPTTFENVVDKFGQTDPTYATDIETVTFSDVEILTGDETAFTTKETTATTAPVEIGTITDPTGDEVGYSSARIEEVDTSNIINIKNFNDAPEEDAYKITDPDGFYALDAALYDYMVFTDITIYIANDIDFGNKEGYLPISYDIEHWVHVNDGCLFYFGGILDGLGHQLCNLQMVETFAGYPQYPDSGEKNPESVAVVGLFGHTDGATFKNIIIDDSCSFKILSSATNPIASAFSARASGLTVDNCWNQADVSGGRFTGSITGRLIGSGMVVTNYTNSGDMSATLVCGGLAAFMMGAATAENCRNTGKINRIGGGSDFRDTQGGFFARPYSPVTLKGCINNGDVTGAANSGSFVGTTHTSVTIENCTNYAALKNTEEDVLVANFVGRLADGVTADAVVVDDKTVDKYLEQDPTLAFENPSVDFTPDPDPVPNQTTGGEQTTEGPTQTTQGPSATTAAGTTAGGNGAQGTNAPATTPSGTTEEDGCKSTVIGSFAVIAMISGAALVLFKKKH